MHKPAINFKPCLGLTESSHSVAWALVLVLLPKHREHLALAFALLFIPGWLAIGFINSIIVMIIMSMVGIFICGQTAKVMGVHDDGRIVWDEFAGQSIPFLPVLYLGQMNWTWVLIGFALFRLFDVWKPWPIGVIDRQVGGGFGISV